MCAQNLVFDESGFADVTHLLPPDVNMTATCKKDRWGDYHLTVIVPKSHPLFPWDDVRNNPGFHWHLDIDLYVQPLIVQDPPKDHELWLTTTVTQQNSIAPTFEKLWAFCQNPKKKPFKLQPPPCKDAAFVHYLQDPEYQQYADKVHVLTSHDTIMYIPDLDKHYSPAVVANILSKRLCHMVNDNKYFIMTPSIWAKVKNTTYKFYHVYPDMDAEFFRYTKARVMQVS
jgi:hypothetical protein